MSSNNNPDSPVKGEHAGSRDNKILRGQQNYLSWLRIFRNDARTQGTWGWFTGEKTMPSEPLYAAYVRLERGLADNAEVDNIPAGKFLVDDFTHFKFLLKHHEKQDQFRRNAEKLLGERIDPSFVAVVEGYNTLQRKFDLISSMCQMNDDSMIDTLQTEMEQIRLKKGVSIQEYINEHVMLQQDINSIKDNEYSESQLKNKIIRGLPKTWKDFIERYTFQVRTDGSLSFPVFCSHLLTQEAIMAASSREEGGSNSNSKDNNKGKKTRDDKGSDKNDKQKCPKCKKPGHTLKECYWEHPELAPADWKFGGKDPKKFAGAAINDTKDDTAKIEEDKKSEKKSDKRGGRPTDFLAAAIFNLSSFYKVLTDARRESAQPLVIITKKEVRENTPNHNRFSVLNSEETSEETSPCYQTESANYSHKSLDSVIRR